ALHAAHRRGITHRDLKPSNVMLTAQGVKVLDFGLAQVAGSSESSLQESTLSGQSRPLTEAGAILGTWTYMAPEQIEGLQTDARTDIFSLGVLIHEMIT